MPDWTAARAQMMLDPDIINLNAGSFGPTPRRVFDRVTELRRQLAAEPMHFLVRTTPPLLWAARTRLAEFVGADPRRLIFTQSVTAAINIVAASLALESPGEILTSDREYGSMQWCWERAAQRQGLTVKHFRLPLMPKSPQEIIDAVAAELTPRTRLLFFSHVLSANGMILPAMELCDLARRHGVMTVLDGAHAPGLIPVAVNELGCDFYGGNCHKWLLAPIGAGFLVGGPDRLDLLQPMQVSWGYHLAATPPDEPDEFGTTPRLRYLEFEGTRDPCAWLAVPDAIDFQAGLGWAAIRARVAELAAYTRRRLDGLDGLKLCTPSDPAMHGAMTAYWCPPGQDPELLRKRFWDKRIEVLISEWPDGLILRVSHYFFTMESEIDRLADVVPDVLR